jgi:Holliday junction resolvase-like predicted endonuclease
VSDLADRQAAASRQGHEFEAYCETWLKIRHHRIKARKWRHPGLLIEIDRVTEHPEFGEVWVECKGSWESPTGNGLERTDTLKKAIGVAAVIARTPDRRPYWLLCSHLPRIGSAGEVWLAAVTDLFDRVVVL